MDQKNLSPCAVSNLHIVSPPRTNLISLLSNQAMDIKNTSIKEGEKLATVVCVSVWRMCQCPNRYSTDFMDSISVFEDPMLIKI